QGVPALGHHPGQRRAVPEPVPVPAPAEIHSIALRRADREDRLTVAATTQPTSTPSGPAARPPARRRARASRLFPSGTVPARLRALRIGLLMASLAGGAGPAWPVIHPSPAAHDVVSPSEPLSLSAQRMSLSLSDADVTATTAF